MDGHDLFNCSFDIVFTWGFTIQFLNRKGSSRYVKYRYTAIEKDTGYVKWKGDEKPMQAVTSSSYSIENLPPKEVGEFLGIESGRSDDKLKITSPSHNFLKNAKKDIRIK